MGTVGTERVALLVTAPSGAGMFQEEHSMIMSVAHAPVSEATYANVFGRWSDLVVGDRPDGLVDCYLLQTDGIVQISAIWTSREHHDRAVHEEANHPGYSVFEASGVACTHTVYNVVGRVK